MFTGIIETVGTISSIEQEGSNYHFNIESNISNELKIDQSVAHNGVCLTVVAVNENVHRVTAIDETLQKTSLGNWNVGDKVNIERCMVANGRFDGHVVQGHVDQIGTVTSIQEEDGSWLYDFEYDPSLGNVTVEKGSICVNGTSLTCFNSEEGKFRVAIIPYTYDHTVFHTLKEGDSVNLEFDIIGKYVKRLLGK
ncbi:riboflavin synthase [Roseivirga sp.]|jgi:riboflavin synthase|uniref:riboflavin synthase n=1 Tax=Roseivirga sp. TaxID=1964215 RepID=UPI000D7B6A90|nr:riboflavin synthase [Roseivirga sp.]MBO6496653.1 riboflavin synthase [Roseivirga sp.]PWL31717.1 MAG: riboflavin synthase [Roseivirga sp. XM-24bin3]